MTQRTGDPPSSWYLAPPFPLHTWQPMQPLYAQPGAKGCICPPGANRECQAPDCPRKPKEAAPLAEHACAGRQSSLQGGPGANRRQPLNAASDAPEAPGDLAWQSRLFDAQRRAEADAARDARQNTVQSIPPRSALNASKASGIIPDA